MDGPNCLYSTTTFSPNGKRFLVFCSQLFRSSVVHLRPTENITKGSFPMKYTQIRQIIDVILSENSLVNAHPRSSKRRSKKKPTSTKNSPKKAVFNPPTVKIETVKLSSGIGYFHRILYFKTVNFLIIKMRMSACFFPRDTMKRILPPSTQCWSLSMVTFVNPVNGMKNS